MQQLIADFSKVLRVPHLADTNRRENDVEHSYGLALTCWFLQPKIAPELNIATILKYALAHDIVEIYAGDTFVFNEEAKKTKYEREKSAITKLRNAWPDFPELVNFAEQYMDKHNEEAKFVKAVDKILPVIMIERGLENDNFWHNNAISLQDEKTNKVSIRVSEHVSPYYEKLIAWLDERNNIPKY